MKRFNLRRRTWTALSGFILLTVLAACTAAPAAPAQKPAQDILLSPSDPAVAANTPTPSLSDLADTATPFLPAADTQALPAPTQPPPPPSDPVRFAVIGDYGSASEGYVMEADVAALVKSWDPDFIITTGDNNYPYGQAETIDENIGQFYHQFIHPYTGSYGQGAETNRFFPSLGNHDWYTPGAQPYLDYFELPGNERYYEFVWGPVNLFALNSNSTEPDGVGRSSAQAEWLKNRLAASSAPWKIVYMHHPPFSSGRHGDVDWMKWPFDEWGASAVLSGHDHIYERILIDDFPYFINGLGGWPAYNFNSPLPGSQVRYNADYGAMLVVADPDSIFFHFINRQGEIIDTHTLQKERDLIFMPLIQVSFELFSR